MRKLVLVSTLCIVAALFASITEASQGHDILTGVEAISVMVSDFSEDAKKVGLSASTVKTKVELALRRSGISVWDELSQERFFEELKEYSANRVNALDDAPSRGDDYSLDEGPPEAPNIAYLTVSVNYLLHSGLDAGIYNVSVQVTEPARLNRFPMPPTSLPEEARGPLTYSQLNEIELSLQRAMREFMGSPGYILGACHGTLWEREYVAFGPGSGSRDQVLNSVMEIVDAFSNAYLSANS